MFNFKKNKNNLKPKKIRKPLIDPNLDKKQKTLVILKIVLYELLAFLVSLCIVVFILSFQIKKDEMGNPVLYTQKEIITKICNAFYVTGFLAMLLGWLILMVNKNILSPFLYGVKTFLFIFIGQKPKQTYYDYTQERKNKPIHMIYYLSLFAISLPHIIVAIGIHLGYHLY